jgi:hypothetical protein
VRSSKWIGRHCRYTVSDIAQSPTALLLTRDCISRVFRLYTPHLLAFLCEKEPFRVCDIDWALPFYSMLDYSSRLPWWECFKRQPKATALSCLPCFRICCTKKAFKSPLMPNSSACFGALSSSLARSVIATQYLGIVARAICFSDGVSSSSASFLPSCAASQSGAMCPGTTCCVFSASTLALWYSSLRFSWCGTCNVVDVYDFVDHYRKSLMLLS